MWTRACAHLEWGVLLLRAAVGSPLRMALALLVIMIPYLYFSLSLEAAWPAPAPNAARWTEDGTLVFGRPGRALTPVPPPWLTWVKRTNRLQLDLRIQPAGPQSATIFTISDDVQARNLVVEQRALGVIVRLRTSCGGKSWPYRTCDATIHQVEVLTPGTWNDVRIRIEPGRLNLMVDRTEASQDLGPRPLEAWRESYRLALGNDVAGNRGWLGAIAEATVRTPGFVADYVDPAKLESETELRPLERVKLTPFASFSSDDVARNAIMYVPMGVAFALLGLFSGRRGALRAVSTIALISFAMETTQLFLPDRTPSINDLILNSAGGAVGFLACRGLLRALGSTLRGERADDRGHREPPGARASLPPLR